MTPGRMESGTAWCWGVMFAITTYQDPHIMFIHTPSTLRSHRRSGHASHIACGSLIFAPTAHHPLPGQPKPYLTNAKYILHL